ncbi:MAG: hydantoinase/oxoprolinase family protein [Candidatus Bipolaricaulaceae bacterium]
MSGDGVSVGIDVGGTFTDVVWACGGKVNQHKVSTGRRPEEGFLNALSAVGEAPTQLVHGTTVATNALLEGRWAATCLLTTQGFRDVLEIGRQDRPSLYDLFFSRPDPVVPRDWRLEVPERLDWQGHVVRPLHEPAVRALAARIRGAVDSVAVVLLFSFLNGAHERRVREILREEGVVVPITLSSELLPEFREFERTSTVVLSAALRPVVEDYLLRLNDGLAGCGVRAPLLVMQSNGGVARPDQAAAAAAGLLLSGPAAGVEGARWVARAAGLADAITLDMGGTSADVSLIREGRAMLTPGQQVAGRPVRLPMVDVHTVGAGGGSVAWLDPGGALRVGPRSAGAEPGPACYGRGGEEPTVTDAHLVLGRLPRDRPIGGLRALSAERAQAAIAQLSGPLGLSVEEAAWGILEVGEACMERAIRVMTVERGHDPRRLALVAFGGAGPLHGASLAAKLGIPRVLIPAQAGVLSALGLLAADLTYALVRSVLVPLGEEAESIINQARDELREQARRELVAAGVGPERQAFHLAADLRYRGQAYELTVPLPDRPLGAVDVAGLAEGFHRQHQEQYGYQVPGEQLEVVSLRLTAIGRRPKPALPRAPRGTGISRAQIELRPVYFGQLGWVEAPVFARARLPAGAELPAPAVVEAADSTCVIPPGTRGRVDEYGNLILAVEPWTTSR